MANRTKLALSLYKVEIVMSSVSDSTKERYRSARAALGGFCSVMEISPRLDPARSDLYEQPLDFLTFEYRIMRAGYSGRLNLYSSIRFVHLIDCCDLGKSSFRVKSYLWEIKRVNPVAKKIPATIELQLWIKVDFADNNSIAALQFSGRNNEMLRTAFVFPRLRIYMWAISPFRLLKEV